MASKTAPVTGLLWQDIKLPGWLAEQLMTDHDGLLRSIRQAIDPYSFQISGTPDGIQVKGEKIALTLAITIFERIGNASAGNGRTDTARLETIIHSAVDDCLKHELSYRLEGLAHPVRPMSISQVAFMQALLSNDKELTFGIGPTGTGKTHLTIAAAINQLMLGRVKHIVITRPHVVMEGEVVTPASRSDVEYDEQFNVFEDALRDLIGYGEFKRLVEQRMLEITPLGRMRGRTFNESFIIVDDAQNMTIRKMRMAVTRIGQHSRMVVMGDPTQLDLRGEEPSGLAHLLGMIEGTDIAAIHRFESGEIIRARIVARLEELYLGLEDGDRRLSF